jgi:hypothetical protein
VYRRAPRPSVAREPECEIPLCMLSTSGPSYTPWSTLGCGRLCVLWTPSWALSSIASRRVARDRHNCGMAQAIVPDVGPWTSRLSDPQPGPFPQIGLLGHYSNQDLQVSLARLARKLAAVRTGGRPRRRLTTCRQRPRRPGWVLRAIVGVLADHGEPMRVKDIHAAVETALGESVAAPSIKTALIANATGPSRRLVRVAPGRYMLA